MKHTTIVGKKEKLNIITSLVENVKSLMDATSELSDSVDIPFNTEGPFCSKMLDVMGGYVHFVKIIVGDDKDYIDWYLWENDYGNSKKEITVGNITKKIKNPKDLLWCIEMNSKLNNNLCDGCPDSEGDNVECAGCPDAEEK